ncbi:MULTISPECIES: hypothetical protein [unclassified Sporosarcina]|uniref:hypothetical protein n=1 Tax=unclassified Sporosarcina TaxID=2647733 RepID=UPI0012F4E8FE|nr:MULTISPECIES: hypothetical protein [unclassified Sporosarcina]
MFDQVTVRQAIEADDVETFYYLQSFEGRTGEVIKRTSRQLNQFEVSFPGVLRNGIFYADELVPVRKEIC